MSLYDDIAALVVSAQNGDGAAFGELYEKTYQLAYSKAYLHTAPDKELAEDLTQDAFVKMFNNIKSLKSPKGFISWMNRIVVNTVIDYKRRKEPVLLDLSRDEDGDALEGDITVSESETTEEYYKHQMFQPEQYIDYEETKRIIWDCVESLPDRQKLAVDLFYFQDYGISEAAEIMNCKEGSIKSLLFSARANLKKRIEEEEKKGTKLYCNAALAIPFILWMLKEKEAVLLSTGSSVPFIKSRWYRHSAKPVNPEPVNAGDIDLGRAAASHAARSVSLKAVSGLIAGIAAVSVMIGVLVNKNMDSKIPTYKASDSSQVYEEPSMSDNETSSETVERKEPWEQYTDEEVLKGFLDQTISQTFLERYVYDVNLNPDNVTDYSIEYSSNTKNDCDVNIHLNYVSGNVNAELLYKGNMRYSVLDNKWKLPGNYYSMDAAFDFSGLKNTSWNGRFRVDNPDESALSKAYFADRNVDVLIEDVSGDSISGTIVIDDPVYGLHHESGFTGKLYPKSGQMQLILDIPIGSMKRSTTLEFRYHIGNESFLYESYRTGELTRK